MSFKGSSSCWLEKAFANFKRRVQELTGRRGGVSLGHRYAKLAEYVRGGMGYFGISEYLPANSRKRPLAEPRDAKVLLETVALRPYQGL